MSGMGVWMVQVNSLYGRSAFLPYSVGLLQAYAQTDPEVREGFEFRGFVFRREPPAEAVARMAAPDAPGVVALSLYIWNARYTAALGAAVRAAFPGCLVVVGGPHVPDRDPDFFRKNPWADVAVHGEGEETFREVLLARLRGGGLPDIPGASRNAGGEAVRGPARPRAADIDRFPSPYLSGTFDELVRQDYDWLPSQETNRGCPYACAFCDWGSSVFTKVRRFSDDRLVAELDWFAAHKAEMLYNCDANWGIYERDVALTRYMAGLKRALGHPGKFRAAYAKNSGERVYQISKILNDAGMCKGVTLSFQSMDDATLEAVRRKNIGVEVFKGLMKRYRDEGIPTYSELIIGLPGETYDSFADGLCSLLDCGQHDGVNVYTCEVLPNSELNRPEYRERHGVRSVTTPQVFYHATPSDDGLREEYEIVTATATLPPEDWHRCEVLACFVQALHCLGLTQHLAVGLKARLGLPYREFYERLVAFAAAAHGPLGRAHRDAADFYTRMAGGGTPELVDPRFGAISWPPEEYLFLKCVAEFRDFYDQVFDFALTLSPADEYLDDLLEYQEACVKTPARRRVDDLVILSHDLPAVLSQAAAGAAPAAIEPGHYVYRLEPVRAYDRLDDYARECVWYGRKGGRMLRAATLVEGRKGDPRV